MEATRRKDTAKGLSDRPGRWNTLLGAAGWMCLVLGAVLFSLGLWKQLHGTGGPLVATYRDGAVYVEAMYGREARIPKEAELRAYLVRPEDPEGYAQKMAAAMTAIGRGSESAPMNAIYHVGFYVGEREIEPAAPVNVVVQVLGDGFSTGEAIKVVHLREEEAELIADTAVDDAGFVSFTTDGFSDFVFFSHPDENTVSLNSVGDPDSDMAGLVSDVTITDQKGETVADGKLFVGEKYTCGIL